MEIKFLRTDLEAKLPKKNHKDPLTGDVGFDLFSTHEIKIPARGSAIVPVGLKLGYITPGYWFRIEGRSGLGFTKGVQPHFGVIDNSYRGDLGIKAYNLSDIDVQISEGQAIAQFIVYRMIGCEVSWTDVASEGIRGENGFGSSDKT